MNIFLYIVFLFSGILSFTQVNAETVRVITKENAIRAECRFFAPIKAKIYYSDVMDVASIEGDWLGVKFKNVKGCIHKTAVEEKQFLLSNIFNKQKTSATGDEVALAGKGFNPQVENAYRKDHPEMNYHAVDLIVSYQRRV